MPKNPNWAREELILALDLYFRLDRRLEGPTHPEVERLSDVLNRLPLHGSDESNTFRNPAGVAMKLGNFRARDPDSPGAGLQRGNRLEAQVWEEFAGDTGRLRAVAAAIRSGMDEAREAGTPEEEEEEFAEGRVLTRVHRLRERNRRAVARKKKQVLAETGRLACEACGFDFQCAYGPLGTGFAECHHIVPVSEAPQRKTVRTADLAILCANCHRMIHRTRPIASLERFRKILEHNGCD